MTLVVPFCDELLGLPFFVFAGVVGYDIRYRSLCCTTIGIVLVRFEMSDRDHRMDLPCTRDLEFVCETTDGAKDLKGAHPLRGQFVGYSIGEMITRIHAAHEANIGFLTRCEYERFVFLIVVYRHLGLSKDEGIASGFLDFITGLYPILSRGW